MAENNVPGIDMPEEDYQPDLIQLTDEEGVEFNFEVIDAIETEDGRYVALVPMAENGDEINQDDELVILKTFDDDETNESYFEEIEDDDEYDTVADLFVERLKDFYEMD